MAAYGARIVVKKPNNQEGKIVIKDSGSQPMPSN